MYFWWYTDLYNHAASGHWAASPAEQPDAAPTSGYSIPSPRA